MSADPRHGVVDRNCRVHGTTNLFIAGSSVFPTSGQANPTLLLTALAVRLADHLAPIVLAVGTTSAGVMEPLRAIRASRA
jgi:choline dehydrogenase-like flavoprotein